MDAHDVGRGRGGSVEALKQIQARALVIAIESDILFPVTESRYLADHIPNADLVLIDSPYGHDGFLLEFEQITKVIRTFLQGSDVPQMQ
jgi:homoserine O-acetyltransferase